MSSRDQILDLKQRISAAVIGQEAVVEQLLVALLANGHLLMEGLPGLAKTRTIKTLAKNLESQFSRIQFTPDLLPSDITGTEIYTGEGAGGSFVFQQGPVFGNLILADEINRAPAKAQAALLEAMEERQVTIAGKTHKLPELFLVLATQNPIEQEGTYPLPEAQMDRFLLHVFIGYSSDDDERKILRLVRGEDAGIAPATNGQIPAQSVFDARKEVLAYNEAPGEPYFKGVDPHVFAFQLALRVREPSLLNQAKVGICGENSLMIFFAKNNPAEFAEYAVSIMRTGSGKFHGLMVKPLSKNSWGTSLWELQKGKLAEADFVTMASLAGSLFGDIKEGTTPREVCALLSRAGFSDTQDKICQGEAFPGSAASMSNLNEAADAVKKNKIVILGVHAELIRALRDLKAFYAKNWSQPQLKRGSGKKLDEPIEAKVLVRKRKPGPREERHWILVTHLEPTQTHVTIKFYSWQDPLHAMFELDTFLSYYEGYVAADPPPTKRKIGVQVRSSFSS